MTPSLFNWYLEVCNMIKAMIWVSSIKTKINDMLLEEHFLKTNVLFINQQKVGTEYEKNILKLYKPQKYQDEIQTVLNFNNLKIKLDRYKIPSSDLAENG